MGGSGQVSADDFNIYAQRKQAVRALTHSATIALGLTNIYLLALTGPLVSTQHDMIYHMTGAASVIFIPVIIYVLIVWLLLTALLMRARRPGHFRVVFWTVVALALPWVLFATFSDLFKADVPGWVNVLIGAVSLAGIVLVAGWKRLRPVFDALQPLAETVLGFTAILGVLIVCELLWFGWKARDLNPAPSLHRASVAAGSPKPRIIWILLDELSYQQVYGQRFPGLQLPAFDRLAAESTVFTHVVPVGEYTRYAVPSLLTGIPSDEVSVTAAGMLGAQHDTYTRHWDRFDQHNTVFQDALDAGYSTGLVGWYNPYCRILPSVLDHCYWTYREDTPGNLSPKASAMDNLIAPVRSAIRRARHLLGDGPGVPSDVSLDIQMHSQDYVHLLHAGDALLSDPSADFILIHMPVPHPLGFYDRSTGKVAKRHTSYIDNLALADRYLGHVRKLLEQQGQWDSSTIVVMGDHSWRTKLIWARSPAWSAEDAAASHGGQFDDRPGYIVKLPYQQTPAEIDKRFAAVRTRSLFDALMQGQIKTPIELQAWASR